MDKELYINLLKAVGSLSRLFSENERPFLHHRFVEKLFIKCSGAIDLARKDNSFDALLKSNISGNIGVGIKTFVANNVNVSKREKIAEFTRDAKNGIFDNLGHEKKAEAVSELRNKRVISDANEYQIKLEHSFYHCLVRIPNGAFIHQEEYPLIDTKNIAPIDSRGRMLGKFPSNPIGHTYFSDGKSNYCFNRSKNVLYKDFDLSTSNDEKIIQMSIYEGDIFKLVIDYFELAESKSQSPKPHQRAFEPEDYVILPLYSVKDSKKFIYERSGINQWNANGRVRSSDEAYIPVPKEVRTRHAGFFPDRDSPFEVELPGGERIIAKICQADGKALMSNPNTSLCRWIFGLIDADENSRVSRFENRTPYKYEDLLKIGKDSVRIQKIGPKFYKMSAAPVGSYEKFLDICQDDDFEEVE